MWGCCLYRGVLPLGGGGGGSFVLQVYVPIIHRASAIVVMAESQHISCNKYLEVRSVRGLDRHCNGEDLFGLIKFGACRVIIHRKRKFKLWNRAVGGANTIRWTSIQNQVTDAHECRPALPCPLTLTKQSPSSSHIHPSSNFACPTSRISSSLLFPEYQLLMLRSVCIDTTANTKTHVTAKRQANQALPPTPQAPYLPVFFWHYHRGCSIHFQTTTPAAWAGGPEGGLRGKFISGFAGILEFPVSFRAF